MLLIDIFTVVVTASIGETRWTGRIRPEQGSSSASLPEVQAARLLLSPYQLTRPSTSLSTQLKQNHRQAG